MPMIEVGKRTFTAGEDLAARTRVKIESGTATTPPEVVYADAGEPAIGVTEYSVADGELVTIKLNNHAGTQEVTAAGTLSIGSKLYAAADGKVSATAVGPCIGEAIESANADEIIEALLYGSEFYLNPSDSVTNKTAVGTIVQGQVDSAVEFGTPVYMTASGTYKVANASAADHLPAYGIALTSGGSTGETINILFEGVAENSAWAFTIGDQVYVPSGVALQPTQTSPTGNVQTLGIALSATKVQIVPNFAVV